jgi:PTS system nitrogen regulatory IIA component
VETGRDPVPTPDRLIAIADVLGLPRAALVELARQAGAAVSGYLHRTPEANALFLEIARRNLNGTQIARVKAFIDSEFPEPSARVPARRLVDLLPRSHVVLRLSCNDWEDLVSIAATRLGRRIDHRHVVRKVMDRERQASTALGGGFAAPHAFIEGMADAAVLVTLSRPLPLATPDGRPVRVAILVVSGTDARSHLEIMTRIARLASYDVVDELSSVSTPEKVRAIVERIESLW